MGTVPELRPVEWRHTISLLVFEYGEYLKTKKLTSS